MIESRTYTHLEAHPTELPRRYDRSALASFPRPPVLRLPAGVDVATDDYQGTAAAAAWWRRLAEVATEIAAWHDQKHDQKTAEGTTAGGTR